MTLIRFPRGRAEAASGNTFRQNFRSKIVIRGEPLLDAAESGGVDEMPRLSISATATTSNASRRSISLDISTTDCSTRFRGERSPRRSAAR
ncbi:hypothetical protein GS432_14660 [Rhodococcus hoagii]|nr:hypothetical protein [Prescottella equi]